jgi:hypothetical protein
MSFSVEFNPYFYIFNLFAFKSNDERIMFIYYFFTCVTHLKNSYLKISKLQFNNINYIFFVRKYSYY